MIIKLDNLNYRNIIKNFNSDFTYELNSINSVVCSDNSVSDLFKIIGRIETNYTGEIKFTDNNVKAIYISQLPSSFPWLNIEENIKYVIDNSSLFVKKAGTGIQKIIDDVALNGYEKHLPDNNSLGFRFRISLARALVFDSALILIDNSFAKMDDETKFELFDLIKNISKKYNVSFLINTKNISDAIYLSENIYLMKEGMNKFLDSINLFEEWKQLEKENKGNRQQKIIEKIINIFTKNNIYQIF